MHENGNFRIRLELDFLEIPNSDTNRGKEIISRRKSRVINTWTRVVA